MLRKTIEISSGLLPFIWLQKFNTLSVVSIFYHVVGREFNNHFFKGLYNIPSEKDFEQDIDFLLSKYQPVDLQKLIMHVREGEPLPPYSLFLSFDDGLAPCYDVIAPILKRKGVPATFFLNTKFIGQGEKVFYRLETNYLANEIAAGNKAILSKVEKIRGVENKAPKDVIDYLKNIKYHEREALNRISGLVHQEKKIPQLYMDEAQIKNLLNNGFTIGAHSIDHPEYEFLSEEDQLTQTVESMLALVQMFNLDYKVFAFPYSDVGVKASFFKELNKRCNPDITFGTSGLKKDSIPTNLQRIPMDDRNLNARQRLKLELLYFAMKKPLGKNFYNRY